MKGRIKIIDFRFSRYIKKGELAKSVLGSPIYMSPIRLNKLNKIKGYEDIKYDDKEDIWSLGITCYELLVGENPFDSESMEELVQKVNIGDYYMPITLSKEAMSFLNCMIQLNPQKRLDIEKLCNHEFLRKNVKEFTKLDLNTLKNMTIIDDSKILINTKINSHICDILGDGMEESIRMKK